MNRPLPLLCRLHFHQWYIDGAMFTYAQKCNRCDHPRNQADADALALERKLWADGPEGEKLEDARRRVRSALDPLNILG